MPDLLGLSHRETDSGFKYGSITPSAIFTRLGTQRLSLLSDPKRRCTWTPYQIRWGGKENDARLAITATKIRLLQRNLYPTGTVEQKCRRRWGLHWRLTLTIKTWRIWWARTNASKWQMGFNSAFKGLMSLYRIYFCCKSVYNIFPIFVPMTFVGIKRKGHNFWNFLLQWSSILKLFQAQRIMCIE